MNNKLIFIFSLFYSCIQLYAQSAGKPPNITVITYNIRLNTLDDGVNAWPNRKNNITLLIREQNPSLFGLQEALPEQVADVESAFPGFGRVGVGRDDGKSSGEFSPIFFDRSRFKLKESGTFWLSQTPSKVSRGWDAACNRIVTWAILEDQESGKIFGYFNTHFDHMGEVARRNSAYLLLHAVDSLAKDIPVAVTGDFNSTPDAEPIRIITDQSEPSFLMDSKPLSDSQSGPGFTYTGFEVGAIPGQLIDYVFVKKIIKVSSYKVLDYHIGKYYPSDHLPVVVKLIF
jgi:endonuclease/exonuclease/phosphatase family metal-dependent hydrolase